MTYNEEDIGLPSFTRMMFEYLFNPPKHVAYARFICREAGKLSKAAGLISKVRLDSKKMAEGGYNCALAEYVDAELSKILSQLFEVCDVIDKAQT